MSEPAHPDIVHALALSFAKVGGKEHADDLAMLNLHAALTYFAARRGFAYAFEVIAEIYDEYAELAVIEREKRMAALRRKHG